MSESVPPPYRPLLPNVWGRLLVLLGFILLGLVLGSSLGFIVLAAGSSFFGGLTIESIPRLLEDPNSITNGWYALMLLQAVVHICTFLLPCLLYWWFIERRRLSYFALTNKNSAWAIFPVALVVLVSIPLIGLTIEWNADLTLPRSLHNLEDWMKASEESAESLTKKMLSFEGLLKFLIASLVIAVIPALGEELIFRGVLQRKLSEAWGNPHAAIWVSALLFSSIHLQFYGFVPRMLLGAMFGYIYWWTGKLSLTVFAHFLNNWLVILGAVADRKNLISVDLENMDMIPAWLAGLSLVLSGSILYYIYKNRWNAKPVNLPPDDRL